MLLAAVVSLALAQQVPARVVVMDATLEGKPYGKVTYIRGILPGKGYERTVTLEAKEADETYTVQEKRTYGPDGTPTSTVRTVTQGARKIVRTLTYQDKVANVTTKIDGEEETESFKLEEEGASLRDASQAWFYGSAPEKNAKVSFWEFSLDDNDWVEREVTYTGTADVKVGDKTVKGAHRISIGKFVNFYVDEFGMPYRSIQETGSGTLNLIRTDPPIKETP
jgi:hypothetical protein